MRDFDSFGAFADHLAGIIVAEKVAEQAALTKAAKVIEKEAKAEFGTYQGSIGDIVAWAELADSTKDDRVRQGYTENDPLLRAGVVRDSIGHKVGDGVAYVGSDEQILVYLELGTSKMPPRSTLAGAAMRKADQVHKIAGSAVVAALLGKEVHEGALILDNDD